MTPRPPRLPATLVLLLLASCGGGGGGGGAAVDLVDQNADGTIVIVCFGDSITRGTGDGEEARETPPLPAGYPARLQERLGVTVINAGQGGENTEEGRRRIDRVLDENPTDYVVILEGVNDVSDRRTTNLIPDLESMIGSANGRGVVPLIATLTPTCCNRVNQTPPGRVNDVSVEIRDLAERTATVLVDFNAAFAPEGVFDPASGLIHTPDGLHPTLSGYDLMSDTVAELFGF
ncbi:MAG: SGNH/GDSL hydrolase family protein [Candidatus Binatia bacterium]